MRIDFKESIFFLWLINFLIHKKKCEIQWYLVQSVVQPLPEHFRDPQIPFILQHPNQKSTMCQTLY